MPAGFLGSHAHGHGRRRGFWHRKDKQRGLQISIRVHLPVRMHLTRHACRNDQTVTSIQAWQSSAYGFEPLNRVEPVIAQCDAGAGSVSQVEKSSPVGHGGK